MVTVVFFRRNPTILEQLKGLRAHVRMVLGSTIVGVPFVFCIAKNGSVRAERRSDWAVGAKTLGEFIVPVAMRLPDLLKSRKVKVRNPLATALMQHLITRGLVQWKDHNFANTDPEDVLAACLTTPSIAKVRG